MIPEEPACFIGFLVVHRLGKRIISQAGEIQGRKFVCYDATSLELLYMPQPSLLLLKGKKKQPPGTPQTPPRNTVRGITQTHSNSNPFSPR